ncbi:MAG: hypothetical protein WCB04_09575 [Mycobacteriales bacterium]
MDTRPLSVIPPEPPRPSRVARRRKERRLQPGWPITALLLFYPIWWALGLGVFIFMIMAIPMALSLLRRSRVRVPPGFGIWVLFLVWVIASTAMLGLNPPGTVPNSASSRLLPTVLRLAEYLSVTVLLLYIGNLSEKEFPRQRLIRQLGVMFLWPVIGGLIAVWQPHLEFTSPLERLLPAHMLTNPFVVSLVHPAFAQLHEILGYQSPRPAAPFGYTNMWGQNLAILLIWFVVGWMLQGTQRRRRFGYLIIAAAIVPTVYSLNRGVWIGMLLSVLYVAMRLVVRGRVELLGALAGATAVLVAVIALSPLQGLITSRLNNGKSNDVRVFSTVEAVRIAKLSPILGYGNTRNAVGSQQSATVGKTANCPRCGNIALGSNGQLWLVLVTTGFVGAGLYVGFFLYAVWHYRRDRTLIGIGGVLAIGLSLLFMFTYNAMISPLALYMIALALLWRNKQFFAQEAAEHDEAAKARLSVVA